MGHSFKMEIFYYEVVTSLNGPCRGVRDTTGSTAAAAHIGVTGLISLLCLYGYVNAAHLENCCITEWFNCCLLLLFCNSLDGIIARESGFSVW